MHERPPSSPKEFYEGLLNVHVNVLTGWQLREAVSFSFTVTEAFSVYASEKEHRIVKHQHGIEENGVVLEGRVRNNGRERNVYFHTLSYPPHLFKNAEEFNVFKQAVVAALKKKIDPQGPAWNALV